MNEIKIAAAILLNDMRQMALVRKRGSEFFMQAGGKIDVEELPIEALIRELKEELALDVEADEVKYVGQYSAPAANEPDHTVIADIFCLKCNENLIAQAEIEQVIWVTKIEAQRLKLAPLLHNHILKINFDELFD